MPVRTRGRGVATSSRYPSATYSVIETSSSEDEDDADDQQRAGGGDSSQTNNNNEESLVDQNEFNLVDDEAIRLLDDQLLLEEFDLPAALPSLPAQLVDGADSSPAAGKAKGKGKRQRSSGKNPAQDDPFSWLQSLQEPAADPGKPDAGSCSSSAPLTAGGVAVDPSLLQQTYANPSTLSTVLTWQSERRSRWAST